MNHKVGYAVHADVQMPSQLCLEPEPMDGEAVSCKAGHTIAEASVTITNGHGSRITKAVIAGDKQNLVVTQRLWRFLGEVSFPPLIPTNLFPELLTLSFYK